MIDPYPMPTIDTTDALIPAALRACLKDLRLVARHPSTAHGFGLQSSRNRGTGMDADMERDRWMSPAEALDYGLIDKVLERRG